MAEDNSAAAADRLAQIKAERATLAAARAERMAADELSPEALARAERALEDDKAIDKFEREVGKQGEKIAVVPSIVGCVILGRASAAAWRYFVDLGAINSDEVEKLVRGCVLYPKGERLEAIFREQPAIFAQCADGIAYIMGAREKTTAKKAGS